MIVDAEIIYRAVATALGACVGSFLNVCIYRLPQEDLSVGQPKRSFCPQCKAPIRWYDNIPVLSWLWLFARCRSCKKYIPVRYPFVEALTAAIFLGVSIVFPIEMISTAAFYMTLMAGLVVITFIDIDVRIIPDEISVTWAMFVPVAAYFLAGVPSNPEIVGFVDSQLFGWNVVAGARWLPAIGAVLVAGVSMWLMHRYSPAWDGSQRGWWETRLAGAAGAAAGYAVCGVLFVHGWLHDPQNYALTASLLGMATGAGAIYGVGVFGTKLFKQDAMGFGDVKLMGLLGGVVGAQDVLLAIFLACVFGSVVGVIFKFITKDSYIPFGPFLALGSVLMIFAGDHVYGSVQAYLDFSTQADPRFVLVLTSVLMVLSILLLWYLRKQRLQAFEEDHETS